MEIIIVLILAPIIYYIVKAAAKEGTREALEKYYEKE